MLTANTMGGHPYDGRCRAIGPYGAYAFGLFAEDHAFEAWERMTYGGLRCLPAFMHKAILHTKLDIVVGHFPPMPAKWVAMWVIHVTR